MKGKSGEEVLERRVEIFGVAFTDVHQVEIVVGEDGGEFGAHRKDIAVADEDGFDLGEFGNGFGHDLNGLGCGFGEIGFETFPRGGEVAFIDFKSSKICELCLLCGEGGGADAEEWVEEMGRFGDSVNGEALLHESYGKGRGVWAIFVTRHDGVVRHEPGVATAAFVISSGVGPALDVAFIGVSDASLTALKRDVAGFGQVENVFVAVVDEALGIDGLEVTGGNFLALAGVDGDGFDPVKGVLENELRRGFGECKEEFVGKERVLWSGPDVEEERTVRFQKAVDFGGPFLAPLDELSALRSVFVGPVLDADIVGWRGDDEVDGLVGHLAHSGETVFEVEVDHRSDHHGDLTNKGGKNGLFFL